MEKTEASAPVDTVTPSGEAYVITYNSFTREVRKGRTLPSTADQHAPAMFRLSKLAADRLKRVGSLLTSQIGRVDLVRAANVKNSKMVYLFPVSDDPEGIPVRWYRGNAWINLIWLLDPEDHVRTGHRRRYMVDIVEESPVGPALRIELSKPVSTRRVPRQKRKASIE